MQTQNSAIIVDYSEVLDLREFREPLITVEEHFSQIILISFKFYKENLDYLLLPLLKAIGKKNM